MMQDTDDLPRSNRGRPAGDPSGRIVATIAATAATGALTCAVGCVLPFALPAVAMAGAGGIIAWLVQAQGWMMKVALVAVGSGWTWISWRSVRRKARPAVSTLCTMAGATLLLALAAVWHRIEPVVIDLLMS